MRWVSCADHNFYPIPSIFMRYVWHAYSHSEQFSHLSRLFICSDYQLSSINDLTHPSLSVTDNLVNKTP